MAPPEFILKGQSKRYPILMTHVSISLMERETGVTFTKIFDHAGKAAEVMGSKGSQKDRAIRLNQLSMQIGLREIMALLFAGLEGYRRKFTNRLDPITLDETGDVLTDCGGMPGVQDVLAGAWAAYLPSVTGMSLADDRVNGGKKKKAARQKK